ncbi:MAG: hypothetical protein QOJ15_2067 [Bradyrhizobium sp.]|nr:hypothetical protein [Bradyrhizobium sp.]
MYIVARVVADGMRASLGQPVIIETLSGREAASVPAE